MTKYPNLRRMAARELGIMEKLGLDAPGTKATHTIARALLLTLDIASGRGVWCSNCRAGDHGCTGKYCECQCRRLASLEREFAAAREDFENA